MDDGIYLQFFEIIVNEITKVVDESRRMGMLQEYLNSTIITLIPKKENTDTFSDYRPKYLCNLLYKIITKIIDERMRSILGSFISNNQFGFLPKK